MARNALNHEQWYAGIPSSARGPTIAGYAALVFGVFGFGAWASVAPIEGAVLAPGIFVATSQNKIVQHLEGGIIREILVREGELVEAGQTLMRLDETSARADLSRLLQRQAQLLAQEARLRAEAEQKPGVTFPDEIARHSALPDLKPLFDSHVSIFHARRQKLMSEVSIQEQTIAAFGQRIAGDEARIASIKTQLRLVNEELAGKAELYQKGLIRKPEYLALQRLQANLNGEIGRLEAEVGDSRERITGAEQQIARLKHIAVQAAYEELHAASGELKDVRERIITAQSVLGRITIEAPVKGAIVKLNYHTAGGVIKPGNDILALLPLGDELVIEVQIRPQDIDNVKRGQEAIVRMSALNQRTTPMISGLVVYVSADALPNEKKSDDNVYIARVRLDATEASKLKDFLPTPGMPAEIYIKTGERTFFEYLMQPVRDTMARAFRES